MNDCEDFLVFFQDGFAVIVEGGKSAVCFLHEVCAKQHLKLNYELVHAKGAACSSMFEYCVYAGEHVGLYIVDFDSFVFFVLLLI